MVGQSSTKYGIKEFASGGIADIRILPLIAFLVLVTSLITVSSALFAEEPTNDEAVLFNIPRQRADQALTLFAEQTGRTLIFPYDEVREKTTNRLVGKYSIKEGIDVLLEGSGLRAALDEHGEIVIANQKPASVADAGAEEGPRMNGKKTGFFGRLLAGAAVLLGGSEAAATASSEADMRASSVLEEVIVTAQKRTQNLQDVPTSITAVSGDMIRSEGIYQLEELSSRIPNVFLSEATSASDHFVVRGISSGVNLGFEQAVGQVVDGIFYGRSRFGRAVFLDVERVEMLRGPQGAIIGKNTSAGAINITTKSPTREFEAWVSGGYEFEAEDGYTMEGAVSGPLANDLFARVALRYDDRDGYLKNVADGSEPQSREDFTGRLKLLWEPTDAFDATFAYQHGDFDRAGRNQELSVCGPDILAIFDANNITDDCKLDYKANRLDVRNGVNTPETHTTEFDTVGVTLNWHWANHTLTSLTGYAQYDWHDKFDTDFTALELLGVDVTDDYEQFSQELRLTSASGGRFDYIVGGFFQHFEQESGFRIHFANFVPPPIRGSRNIVSEQESDTIAVFGQFTWHLNNQWDVTIGGRYTNEEKEASQEQFATELYSTSNRISLPGGPAANTHAVAQDRSENNFSPSFSLQWHPIDDAMFYGSVRRGFKGGGFDLQLNAPQSQAGDRFQFGEEEVTAFEVGTKLNLLDRRASLNLALFHSKFDDLQVSTISGEFLTFDVGNAGEATSQGVELDARWRPTERLRLTGRIGYLNAEYDSYEGAPCFSGQTPTQGCIGGVQDLSGEDRDFAPDWSLTLNGQYTWALPYDLRLIGFLQLRYSDSYWITPDLEPNMLQDSYEKWDGSLTLVSPYDTWEVSLIARNINDELTSNHGNQVSGNPLSFNRAPESPRSIELNARWRF